MRRAGVLLHISSLPGPGPIGTMGAPARRFVDFLCEAGQTVWQVLPLTPPAMADSPYSAHSVFAGNPSLIDLQTLEDAGAIPAGSVGRLSTGQPGQVDYRACGRELLPLLRRAFQTEAQSKREEIARFRERHSFWLEEYALYTAIQTKQGDISYMDWPQLLALREPGEMQRNRLLLREQIDFWVYVQYLFYTQWLELKEYANARGISVMGDMPIYTAPGSADVWANSAVFQLDARHRPTFVAGVPPDAFTEEGQRWGNPLYDWEYLYETGFSWWIERLRVASVLYDEVRIDHFRALDEYYTIPVSHRDARQGEWRKGPGMAFFEAVSTALPELRLVAEDLGGLTDGVCGLLKDSGLPGMNVLLFAFASGEESGYLPHRHKRHSVSYIGTHDNDTFLGWMGNGSPDELRRAREYFFLNEQEGYTWGMLRGLYGSVSDTAVVQMQDFLGLGSGARMNTPGTVGGNWEWRMAPNAPDRELAQKIRAYTKRYGRLG